MSFHIVRPGTQLHKHLHASGIILPVIRLDAIEHANLFQKIVSQKYSRPVGLEEIHAIAAAHQLCQRKRKSRKHLKWTGIALGILLLLFLFTRTGHAQSTAVNGINKGTTTNSTATVSTVDANHNGLDVNVTGSTAPAHIICDSGCSGGATDTTITGTISAAGADCSVGTRCVSATVSGIGAIGIQTSTAWTGTLQFEASIDGTNFVSSAVLPIFPIAGGVTSSTANGTWTIPAAGISKFRIRASTLSSGTVSVTMIASPANQFSVGLYDPKISGPDAAGAVETQGPLLGGGIDPATGIVHPFKTASDGTLQVNLSGLAVACAGLPALTGDVTTSSGSCATTLGPTVTGNKTFTGITRFKNTDNTIRYVDDGNPQGWAGGDACAWIASAEADLPAGGGVVDARGLNNFSTYPCAATLAIGTATQAVYLLLPEANLLSSANPGFTVAGPSCIIGTNTFGAASRLQNQLANADTITWTGSYGCMQDVNIEHGFNVGTLLHITVSGGSNSIRNDFRNVRLVCSGSVAGSVGVRLTSATGASLVTENHFDPISFEECETDLILETSGTTGPTDNWFTGYSSFSTSGFGLVGINILSGGVNHFGPGIISAKTIGIQVAAGASFNDFDNMRMETNTTNIINAGVGTMFRGLSLDVNSFTDTGTGTIVYGRSNVPVTQKMGNDLTLFGAAIGPTAAGGQTNGTNALPWGSVFVGTAVTNNDNLLPDTMNAARTVSLPDSSLVLPFNLRTTADFVTAANTNLQTITGLSWVMPANTARNQAFDCYLMYSQQTAAVANDAFGIQAASLAPTQINAQGSVQTAAATAHTEANLIALATTTATNIVAFTPSAITTVWNAELHGMIENPSGVANTINVMVKTGTAGDTMTVKRDSYCLIH